MSTQSSMLHVRLDTELKDEATKALASMGLTATDAVRLLFHRVVADQSFPLELKVPNTQTRTAIEEARAMINQRTARFENAKNLLDGINGEVG